MQRRQPPVSLAELRTVLRPFCQKHRIRRLEVFGSTAKGSATAERDVDLLVTLQDASLRPTSDLLECMASLPRLYRKRTRPETRKTVL